VKEFAPLVSDEDAGAHHIFAARDRRAVIEGGAAGGDVLLLKRRPEIEVEVAAV
jgi:hypothetical protein